MSNDPTPPPSDTRAEMMARIDQGFCQMVPHNRALGMQVVDFGDDWISLRLPWREDLVGNPETGVLHGGAITTLVDSTCGVSVFFKMKQAVPVATLDLRIDYLRPAETRRDVVARADCYKLTRNVAFVRALAYHDDPADPIASATGTFMISTAGAQVVERAELFERMKQTEGK